MCLHIYIYTCFLPASLSVLVGLHHQHDPFRADGGRTSRWAVGQQSSLPTLGSCQSSGFLLNVESHILGSEVHTWNIFCVGPINIVSIDVHYLSVYVCAYVCKRAYICRLDVRIHGHLYIGGEPGQPPSWPLAK